MKSRLLLSLFISLSILFNQSCTTLNNKTSNIPVYKEDQKLNIKLVDGKGEVTFYKDHLNTITIIFDTGGYKHINASIISDGNIRFNTVGFENEEDGPYGKELDLPLEKSGNYTINLGPSLMAENYAKNIFRVSVNINLSNK